MSQMNQKKTFPEQWKVYKETIENALNAVAVADTLPSGKSDRGNALLPVGRRKTHSGNPRFGICQTGGIPEKQAMPVACAVEMIQAYSLIHDDLPCMDDDAMRRGKPSCHVQFDEATALLAGDGLLTCSFETAVQSADYLPASRVLAVVKKLSECAGYQGMIGGQVIDLASEGKKNR